jgi:hypothetical protein
LKAVHKLQLENDKPDLAVVEGCSKQAAGQGSPREEPWLEEPSLLQLDDGEEKAYSGEHECDGGVGEEEWEAQQYLLDRDEQNYSNDPIPDEYRAVTWDLVEEYAQEEENAQEEYAQSEEYTQSEEYAQEEYALEEEDSQDDAYARLYAIVESSESAILSIYSDLSSTDPAVLRFPLTERVLNKHTCGYEDIYIAIPPGPYEFLKNPNHPAIELAGSDIGCPDGCLDHDIFVTDVMRGKRTVNVWFDRHFTPKDVHLASLHDPVREIPRDDEDRPEEWHVAEPLLFGASMTHEFTHLKRVYEGAHKREAIEGCTAAEKVMQNMREGEFENYVSLSYYHGQHYDAIVAAYEPRYIPSDGQWPYDTDRPIWEARGLVGPGQEDWSWWKQTQIEYNRQWRMYRLQDEARMEYVAEARAHARRQYYEAGLLPRMSINGYVELSVGA